MKFVQLPDLTTRQWYDLHLSVYNKDLAYHMGTDPRLIVNAPDLNTFYLNMTKAYDDGVLMGWGILGSNNRLKGYAVLDGRAGEWELGVALINKKDWKGGVGVRAALLAMKWVFEVDKSDWVIAFAQGVDDSVKSILLRGGFRKFMSFYVMDKETWESRWKAHMEDRKI